MVAWRGVLSLPNTLPEEPLTRGETPAIQCLPKFAHTPRQSPNTFPRGQRIRPAQTRASIRARTVNCLMGIGAFLGTYEPSNLIIFNQRKPDNTSPPRPPDNRTSRTTAARQRASHQQPRPIPLHPRALPRPLRIQKPQEGRGQRRKRHAAVCDFDFDFGWRSRYRRRGEEGKGGRAGNAVECRRLVAPWGDRRACRPGAHFVSPR